MILTDVSMTLFLDGSEKCIEIENQTLKAYKGIKFNGRKYTSRLHKKLKKAIDYFIGLKSGSFGIAKFYTFHENIKYVFFEQYEVVVPIGHILNVKPTNLNIFAPADSICKKYIYMNLNNKEYIACMPNDFENE